MRQRKDRGFTIIELLVVVSIIALLISILVPAVTHARDQAKQTLSLTNLRDLGVAHGSYEAEWNGRQFSLVNDSISQYGNSAGQAFGVYYQENGGASEGAQHPGANLGWGYVRNGQQITGQYVLFQLPHSPGRKREHRELRSSHPVRLGRQPER